MEDRSRSRSPGLDRQVAAAIAGRWDEERGWVPREDEEWWEAANARVDAARKQAKVALKRLVAVKSLFSILTPYRSGAPYRENHRIVTVLSLIEDTLQEAQRAIEGAEEELEAAHRATEE